MHAWIFILCFHSQAFLVGLMYLIHIIIWLLDAKAQSWNTLYAHHCLLFRLIC
jgi:hypothetical protein